MTDDNRDLFCSSPCRVSTDAFTRNRYMFLVKASVEISVPVKTSVKTLNGDIVVASPTTYD